MLAAAALFMTLAQATTHAAETERYLIDSGGKVVTSPTAGVCVQTSEWKPGTGVPPCDPEAAKKVAAPTPPPPAPAPKPAAAPAPKPVVAQAAPQKISFSADVLFDFNKATLKTSAVKPLDDVVQLLNNATFSAISVVGHTDRLGRAEYNKKLSQQRARAVADYLVSHGIPTDKVRAEGRGETQPQTRAGGCSGLSRAKMITCLQPDRRVDVEVSGTKPAI